MRNDLTVGISFDGFLYVIVRGERMTSSLPVRPGTDYDEAIATVEGAFEELRILNSVVSEGQGRSESRDYLFTHDDVLQTFDAVLHRLT